jgi:hypothetical protein
MLRRITLAIGTLLIAAVPTAAQDQWGVSFAVTPSWQTGPGMKHLFTADRIDMQGSEVRFGFVRGQELSSEWGLSFIRTTIAADSSLDKDVASCERGTCGLFLRTLEPTRVTGIEAHRFEVLKTWRERFQVGTVGAVGVGWLRGQVYKRTTTDESDVEAFDAEAGELFPPSTSVMPLLRIEIAGSALVAQGLKVRASGGFSMPGYHTFNVTFVYLIPTR